MSGAIENLLKSWGDGSLTLSLFLISTWVLAYNLCAKHLKRRDNIPLGKFLADGGLKPLYTTRMISLLDRLDKWFSPEEDLKEARLSNVSKHWNWVLYDRILILAVLYPLALPLIAWAAIGSPLRVSGVDVTSGHPDILAQISVAGFILLTIAFAFAAKFFFDRMDGRIFEHIVFVVAFFALAVLGSEPAWIVVIVAICSAAVAIYAFRDDFAHGEAKSYTVLLLALGSAVAFADSANQPAYYGWFTSCLVLGLLKTVDFTINRRLARGLSDQDRSFPAWRLDPFATQMAQVWFFIFLAMGILSLLNDFGFIPFFKLDFLDRASTLSVCFSLVLIFRVSIVKLQPASQSTMLPLLLGISIFAMLCAVILTSSLYGSFSPVGTILVLFLGVFPVVNAVCDFFSIGLTRWCLRHALSEEPIWGLPTWIRPVLFNVIDVLGAILSLIVLVVLLLTALSTINLIAGRALVDVNLLLSDVESGTAEGLWWLYLMIISTFVPTMVHAMIFLVSIPIKYPGKFLQGVLVDWISSTSGDDDRAALTSAVIATWVVIWFVIPVVIWHFWGPSSTLWTEPLRNMLLSFAKLVMSP